MLTQVGQMQQFSPGDEPIDQMTDEQLLVGYRSTSNRELFSELVHRYERELFNYLRRYTGSAEMAEDVFQNTFLQVHLKCEQFEEGRRFRPWVYMIATNQAIDAQRRNKRHIAASLDRTESNSDGDTIGRLVDLLVSDDPGPVAASSSVEEGRWVGEAVGQLSDNLKSVVTLVYYQGMRYREAADVLDIPVGTVKSRLHAAVYKLHEAWRRTHSEEDPKL